MNGGGRVTAAGGLAFLPCPFKSLIKTISNGESYVQGEATEPDFSSAPRH